MPLALIRAGGLAGHAPVRSTNRAGDRVGWPLWVRRTTVSRSTLRVGDPHRARRDDEVVEEAAPGTTVSRDDGSGPASTAQTCPSVPSAADGPDQSGAAVEEEAAQ